MNLTADTELVVCSVETMAKHPELFHYTHLAAFESIVRSNSVWASHYSDMADKDEVLLMRNHLPPVLAPRFEEVVAPMNRHYRRLFAKSGGGLGLAKSFVDSVYAATFLAKGALGALDAFLVSFTTHAQDTDFEREHGVASQWRDYAGPNGICMVLDTATMAANLGREFDSRYWVHLTLEPVRYADAPIDQIFPELVDASADTLKKFTNGTRYPEMAVPEFLSGATLLKGVTFKPERELRIVAIPGTKRLSDRAVKEHPDSFKVMPLPELRTRTDTTRRYIALFDALSLTLPLKRVIIGPSPNQAVNVACVKSLVGTVPVVPSNCRP